MMNFSTVIDILKRYWTYGIFLTPLAPRFGGGWKGILAATAARTLLFSIPYGLLLRVFSSEILFAWLLSTSVMVLYTLFLEIRWHRKGRR